MSCIKNLIAANLFSNYLFSRLVLLALLTQVKVTSASEPELFLVTEHLPPYQIVDQNSQLSGFSVELVHEVLKRSGYSYQMNVYSWVRSYNLTLQKPNHCIFSIARLPIRENLFQWIGQITELNNAVIWGIKAKQHDKINDIEEIKKYLIAVNKNDATHLGLVERGFVENKNLYVLEHTNSLINLLMTRPEIDFIVADDITIAYRAELAGVDFDSLQRVFEVKDLQLDFHLACNKQTPKAITDKLTQALKSIHSDGFYQNTLAKWRGKMNHR
ncbi:hypothetical protein tinsulaeT_13350 [Thalassotalea insulae]|uniref:Solute-binding protein family 3/N-terminal domain-containing protein n=1 Tax=Thalassotalea insulae TaxID=2056778 RepID=A0ABQ6GU53_9GAMM|nr:ABC transporter substrate-binding protein [Thalassotalea insulae]GLX77995.1 hypothetical protein tinsulaeT_13350 [Thalassotalea insulae]